MGLEGLVTKAVASFYSVRCEDGIRQCRARGVFRKRGVSVLVGDRVEISPIGLHEGVITEVMPRSTELVRPPVANVNQALLVFSVVSPDFQGGLLDRMLVQALAANLNCVIVLTKCDLVDEAAVECLAEPYSKAGFKVIRASVRNEVGLSEIRAEVDNKISVFAGPSGVGKSTIANALSPQLGLKMGEISEKLGRGKHTTRHVELFELNPGTFIADAPGFSQLEVQIDSRDLREYFLEFSEAASNCAYRGCVHVDEVDCGVKAALLQGEISVTRYDSYTSLYKELVDREGRQY